MSANFIHKIPYDCESQVALNYVNDYVLTIEKKKELIKNMFLFYRLNNIV